MTTPTTSLKIPSGTFTHSELAAHNGKTNQQVWAEYKRLRDEKIIVSAGQQAGVGKPKGLWQLNSAIPVPLFADDVQSKPRVIRPVNPAPVVFMTVAQADSHIAPIVEAKLASVKPAKSPVVAEKTVQPTVVKVDTEPEVEQLTENVKRVLSTQVTEIDQVCPFCQTKLLCVEYGTGYKVWCRVNDIKKCSSSENPYGVATTVKNAVDVLHDKFFKHRLPSAK